MEEPCVPVNGSPKLPYSVTSNCNSDATKFSLPIFPQPCSSKIVSSIGFFYSVKYDRLNVYLIVK